MLDALPNSPGGRDAVVDLIETLRATGTRKPQGSPTDFNTHYRHEIGRETPLQQGVAALRSGGAALVTQAGDASRRFALGRNNARLAEIFTAPDSVDRIASIVARQAETPYANALIRLIMETPAAVGHPR